MVGERGGLETAKILIDSDHPSDGYTDCGNVGASLRKVESSWAAAASATATRHGGVSTVTRPCIRKGSGSCLRIRRRPSSKRVRPLTHNPGRHHTQAAVWSQGMIALKREVASCGLDPDQTQHPVYDTAPRAQIAYHVACVNRLKAPWATTVDTTMRPTWIEGARIHEDVR
jgi:hypothetical protein